MLDSILTQTYKDFIVVIYDNCSNDDTTDTVEPYLSDKRFSYYRQNTMSDNFNYALKHCNTEYLLIVHDDDTMLPNMIKEEIEILEANNDVSMVWTNTNHIDAENNVTKTSVSSQVMNNEDYIVQTREYYKLFINIGNTICFPTVMFRMSVIQSNNLYFRNNVGKARDCYMWLELNQFNYKFYYINNALYNYRIHKNQDSNNTLFMLPLLRKPVYDLLVKNKYSSHTIFSWLHFVNNEIILEISKQKNVKESFDAIKDSIFIYSKKDIFLRIRLYFLLKFPACFKSTLLLMNKVKKILPKSIKRQIKKIFL